MQTITRSREAARFFRDDANIILKAISGTQLGGQPTNCVGWTRIMGIAFASPTQMRCFFEKKRGNNKYIIFATYQGFDLEKPLKHQTDKFNGWPKTQKDFYEEVVSYYLLVV